MLIPVALSNRHIHLSQVDFHRLFGPEAKLQELNPLSQPGQYASTETVDIIGPKRPIYGVRILGPFRKQTQVEISISDGFILGINPPVRLSGDIEGTPGIHLMGSKGAIEIKEGVICAARHIHMSSEDALKFSVKDKQVVAVHFPGKRAGTLDEIIVRVDPRFKLDFHVDIDEGNALGLKNDDLGVLIKDLDH
ncbi:MAG: phosphate propanoyltransferase, partial [Candidatus Hodarchaeales archaeon]